MTDTSRQLELDEKSPSWVARRLEDETTPPDDVDMHEYRETLPYEEPKWTNHNGWLKWHAERDCGAPTIYLIEDAVSDINTDENRAWTLYCARCGSVQWDEVIYLHRDWYHRQFEEGHLDWRFNEGLFRDLWLHQPFVCETGGVPSNDEARDLIRRSWYEAEAQNRMSPPLPWEEDG